MKVSKIYTTIDAHVAGEPSNYYGRSARNKRRNATGKTRLLHGTFDYLREILMYEPRGHHGMYGCIITPPASAHADFGVLFMHNEGWSTMCGHGIIAVITVGIETGMLEVKGENKSSLLIAQPEKLLRMQNITGVK